MAVHMAYLEVFAHAELNLDIGDVPNIILDDITNSPAIASPQMRAHHSIDTVFSPAHIFLPLSNLSAKFDPSNRLYRISW
jgi:hypothetical protein